MNDPEEDWTPEDMAAAEREGWNLFECSGSSHGTLQIQSFDDPSDWQGPQPYPFTEDSDAWVHVRTRAAQGSPLHIKALELLEEENPEELARILAYPNQPA